jgi:hypothetical protein
MELISEMKLSKQNIWMMGDSLKSRLLILIIFFFLLLDLSYSENYFKNYIYSKNDPNVFSTSNWTNFRPEDKVIKYTFEYPSNWTLSDTVFLDQNQRDIGELAPGVVILKKNQKLLQVIKGEPSTSGSEEEESDMVLISKQKINFAKYEGVQIIESIPSENSMGSWSKSYIVSYYLQNKNRVFIFSFYEEKLNSNLKSIFDRIVKSFRFLD